MQRKRKIISLCLAIVMTFAVLTATFGLSAGAASANSFKVTFEDWDQSVIQTTTVRKGRDARPPADPERDGYTFTGWDGDYTKVTEDRTITATYEENAPEVSLYTVNFYDWDGTLIESQTVEQGGSAVAPADPVREGYTFTGWGGNYVWVLNDVDVTAQYEAKQGYVYEEITDAADISENGEYIVVAWRYFGGTESDSKNGYIFSNTLKGDLRAKTEDDYASIIYADEEVPAYATWKLSVTDGKITMQNVDTGKYVGADLGAVDEPYEFILASGECNGYFNFAIGNTSSSLRYSNSSAKFALGNSTPATEVSRAWASNITIYEKVSLGPKPAVTITSADEIERGKDYVVEFTVENVTDDAVITVVAGDTEYEAVKGEDGTYTATIPADTFINAETLDVEVSVEQDGKTYSEEISVQVTGIVYVQVTDLDKLYATGEYVVVGWRYFGGTDSDSTNGYIFSNTLKGDLRAPTADEYATITYAGGEIPAYAMWSLAHADGKITMKNLDTGKYLSSTLGAADEPYEFVIASGAVNGYENFAIGNDSKSIRYSGTSASFSLSASAPANQVNGTNACNITIYQKIEAGTAITAPDPIISITSDRRVAKGDAYTAAFDVLNLPADATVKAAVGDTELTVEGANGSFTAVVPADVYGEDTSCAQSAIQVYEGGRPVYPV